MSRLQKIIGKGFASIIIWSAAFATTPLLAQSVSSFHAFTSREDTVTGKNFNSFRKQNPGFAINSSFDETRPIVSADGSRLYYARKYSPDNVGGVYDPQDIWIASARNVFDWKRGKNPGRALNSPAADNLCAVLNDSTFIFYISNARGKGFFEERTIRNKKEREAKVTGPVVNNESEYLEACFSPDGRVVLFTARNKNNVSYRTKGDERDIYVSVESPLGWTEPVNLGSVINSPGDEYSPFLSADGHTLYFASERSDSFGDADIYRSYRIGGGWTNWTIPENLGPSVNTPSFDGYFATCCNEEYAYMVSRTNTLGKGDIVLVSMPPSNKIRRVEEEFVKGETIRLERLSFDKGESTLKAASYPDLEGIYRFMNANPTIEIEVQGHTDNIGHRAELRRLSNARVAAVRDFLISKGIDQGRIHGKGYGGSMPVSKINTEAGRALNRRVEFIILNP